MVTILAVFGLIGWVVVIRSQWRDLKASFRRAREACRDVFSK